MAIIIKTIIIGLIEGLTEFIPVSSTAHILLAEHIMGIATDSSFWQAFSICIQSGSILAAVWYFWGTVWAHRSLILKVIVGFIPTGIVGLLLYPLIKGFLSNNTIIGIALIVGGILLVSLRPVDVVRSTASVSYKEAFWIGVAQIFSVIPGMSRSGSTLIGGTWLGIPRSTVVTYSFLLGIPTILGASVVELHHVTGLTGSQWELITLGTVVAFVAALLTIKWCIKILTEKPLAWFGLYRIAIGVLVLLLLR
ncbi:MAG TPA: undecaprenyl-diphosphate phosphatase [Candidatus Paceibacterota bacterium]|jgi:undecaprenyl-diphosphatase|nr:undecaprenyl-diphosphate phosphatase [Candidatus Paceibacterota bacterium]